MSEIRSRRLVVTGVNSAGKSVVAGDSFIEARVAEAVPEYGWHRLWSMETVPLAPNNGKEPGGPSHFPAPGGIRYIAFTVPPGSVKAPQDLDMTAALAEMEEKFPGRAAFMESHQTGLHTTSTIDLVYVAEGEIWLELDDNKEVHLIAGDSLIQNGTRHAWRNHGSRPCTLIVTILGAYSAENEAVA